ncbi:mothers against decapentaplegic homolog 6 isoform X1 [Danaus plexippus]|uniref:mothers against decapentaplegic homolog 6 isoform X1 n=1 Tax=Danaus plexippus TaxID=13037 RepID=UPI002AB31948|nr:mothers against decapentaplegic homolog 6 isoform X1 [Danaus plexippus]
MFRRRALRRRLAAGGAPSVSDDQLRGLARALDAGPAGAACVPDASPALRLAAARVFRYPDLGDLAELRRLPHCCDHRCCNPYHYSRLCEPETPPPPYSRIAMDDVKHKEQDEKTEDARRTDHERLATGSLATDGEERQSWESEWCRLAYWELTQRVGRQLGVRVRAVDVFAGAGGSCGQGRHGLCVDDLGDRGTQVEQVRKTRAKIGLGVTLSLEADGVWLYNRSQEPVFVSSPALDAAAAKALLVWRVAPGHCLCVFDPGAPPPALSLPHVGPVDNTSVRISFAKGWGPKYSRRDVTACPCWLEVLLAPAS